VTDHLPNKFLNTKSAEQFSRRQARWQLDLSRVNPSWVYEKGPTNVADALSRCPNLLHVVATQDNSCAHAVGNPEKERASCNTSLESQTPSQGTKHPNSQSNIP
jgi:hypothetical protein